MAPTKFEQAQRLFSALQVREEELRANEEVVKRATFRSQSLRAAIAELRTTIATLLGDASLPPLPPEAPPTPEKGPQSPLPRTDGTIIARVAAHLETEPRAFDATEIAQSIEVGVDVVRTTLSKMYGRGLIGRLAPGQYCTLERAHAVKASGARKA